VAAAHTERVFVLQGASGDRCFELLQVLAGQLRWTGGFWTLIGAFDLNKVGFGVVAIFIVVWVAALTYWKATHVEDRWSQLLRT